MCVWFFFHCSFNTILQKHLSYLAAVLGAVHYYVWYADYYHLYLFNVAVVVVQSNRTCTH